jgi:hypothetical protein
MLTLAQALDKRGESGVPLPTAYSSLAQAGADICKGQVCLVIGPPSAGKSLLVFNMIRRMGVDTLGFLLDTTELTASARFASILTGDPYKLVKSGIIDGDGHYRAELAKQLPNVKVTFRAPTTEHVQQEINAWEQRYGIPPDLAVVDNLGNQSGMYDNEWSVLKAITLELDDMARSEECAVIACHHTTDLDPSEPASRDKMLGKVSQFARVILSVGYNDQNGQYKIAIVKNSEGKTDAKAERPVTLYADPDRMLVSEYPIGRTNRLLAEGNSQGLRDSTGTSGPVPDDGPPW